MGHSYRSAAALLLLAGSVLTQAATLSNKGYIEVRQQERLASGGGTGLAQRYEALLESQLTQGAFKLDGIVLGRYRAQYDEAPEAQRDALRDEARLRELWLTWSAEQVEVRLGRQQQAWGRGDYFRVLDVINPLDLREFLLPYVDNYALGRQPRDLLIVDYFGDDWEQQLVLAGQRERTRVAPAGSDFALRGTPPEWPADVTPGNGVDIGWRGQRFWRGSDVALYAFQGYHSDAMLTWQNGQWLREQPRRDMLGASLARPAGDWVIRTDVAHYPREGRQTSTGIRRSARSSALLGLDRNQNDWNLNLQLASTYWHDRAEGHRPEWEGSVAVEKAWLQQRLQTGITWMLHQQDDPSQLWRLHLRYDLQPQWKLELTGWWFSGAADTLFGQFDAQDRVHLSLRRDFAF